MSLARSPLTGALLAAIALLLFGTTLALAANDPGHDSLYVLRVGSTNVTGSINLTGNLTATLVQATGRFFGPNLDIRGDGSASPAVNQIIGTQSALEISSSGDLILNKAVTGGMVFVGWPGTPTSLNVSGTIWQQGVKVCLANGTNCVGGNNTGNVSSVTAGAGLSDSGTSSDPVLDINAGAGLTISGDTLQIDNATVCTTGNGLCTQSLSSAGGWTNTTTNTSTPYQVLGPSGSNTAPTFSFSADPDTGIYRFGEDQLRMTFGGTNSLYFDYNTITVERDDGNVNFGGDADVGIQRLGAASLKVTNGASGLGNLTADAGNFTGTLSAGGSPVCTVANGLCGSSGSSSAGGWTNTSTITTTDLDVNISGSLNVTGNVRVTGSASQLILPAGSASAPSLTFGDPDTGFWQAGAGDVLFSADGVNIFELGYGSGAGEIIGMFVNVRGSSTTGWFLLPVSSTSTVPSIGPSYDDQNTGLGWAGADAMTLVSGGAEVARVLPSGMNVTGTLNASGNIYEAGSRVCTTGNGLCTQSLSSAGGWTNTSTTTSTALDVNLTAGNLTLAAPNSRLFIKNGGTAQNNPQILDPVSEMGVLIGEGQVGNAVGFYQGSTGYFVCDANANACVMKSNAYLGWGDATSATGNQIRITSPGSGQLLVRDGSGNNANVTLGILNASGNVYDNGDRVCTASNGLCAGSGNVSGTGSAGYLPRWGNATNLQDSAVYQNGSSIGIGTANPGSNTKLHVAGRALFSGGAAEPLDGSPAGVGVFYSASGDYGGIQAIASGSSYKPLILQPDGGSLGIGITNASQLVGYSLVLANDITSPSGSSGHLRLSPKTGNTSERLSIGYSTGNRAGYLQAEYPGDSFRPIHLNPRGGNVGIGLGTTRSPVNTLEVAGDINASGNVYDNGDRVCTAANGLCAGGISEAGGWTNTSTVTSTALNVNLTAGNLTLPGAGSHLLLPMSNDAATPTLAFGDGDTGMYESTDGFMRFASQGALKFSVGTGSAQSEVDLYVGGIGPLLTTTGQIMPQNIDSDTYMSRPANDMLGFFAGGTEVLRLGGPGANVTGTLNTSGNIYEAGSRVCTAANGLCASSPSTAGGWTNTSTQTTTDLRVGVNTTSPNTTLDVAGDALFRNRILLNSNDTSNGVGISLSFYSDSGTSGLRINNGGGIISTGGIRSGTYHLGAGDPPGGTLTSTTMQLSSTYVLKWTDSAYNGAPDVGLARNGSGTLKITNGGTGAGNLTASTGNFTGQLLEAGSRVCTVANGLCSAAGSANLTGSGVADRIPVWSNGTHLANSILSQSGGALVIDGNISIAAPFFIGAGASATGASAIALGQSSQATGDLTVALGEFALANASSSLAMGWGASATGDYAIAIGPGSVARLSAIGIGSGSLAGSNSSVAIGDLASATQEGAIAIGGSADASHAHSAAIGYGAATTAANQLVLGSTARNLNTQVFGTLNTTGSLYEAGNRVCTSANGLCLQSLSNAGGWTNTSSSTTTSLNVSINGLLNVTVPSATGISGSAFYVDSSGRVHVGWTVPWTENSLTYRNSTRLYFDSEYQGGGIRETYIQVVPNAAGQQNQHKMQFVIEGTPQMELTFNGPSFSQGLTAGGLYISGGTIRGTNGASITTRGEFNYNQMQGERNTAGEADLRFVSKNPFGGRTAGIPAAFYQDTSLYAWFNQGGGLIVNEEGNATGYSRFEGDTDANLFVINATTDRIGIGTGAPTQKLDVNGSGNFSGTGAQLWVAGSQVCTPENGLCAAGAGSGWTNSSGLGNVSLTSSSANVSAGVLFIDNTNQRVGIGNTTPSSSLHVEGTVRVGAGYFEITNRGTTGGNGGPETRLIISDEDTYARIQSFQSGPLALNPLGNSVGIGTSSPTQALEVSGSINVSGTGNIYYQGSLTGYGADLAEYVRGAGVESGDVVIISDDADETVELSSVPYDTRVAGIVSTRPSHILSADEGNVTLALAGRVPVKVSGEGGAIRHGDLLTSSSTPGHAMRCAQRERCMGAIVGKAMEGFEGETGTITALVVLG